MNWAAELRAVAPDLDGATDLFFSAARLSGQPIPPRQWLVDGLIPGRTVTMLGGDGGVGKSILALQLATVVAAGRPWLGRDVGAGVAMHLTAEDDAAELHRRVADIVAAEGLALDELDRLLLSSLAGEDALLATVDQKTKALAPTNLFLDLEAQIAAHQPALVVLDTLADLHAAQENDRAHARQFIGMLRGLAIRHDCAVLVLAHPSLTGMSSGSGLSGSTAWNASVRSRLYLERIIEEGYEANPDRRRLVVKKANYGRTGGEIGLTWRSGVFVADPAETGLDRMAATSKAERVFLKLLRAFTEQGRHVSHATGPTHAPSKFAENPDAEGVTRRAFSAAMERLMRDGKVSIAEHGPPSRRRQHLVEGSAGG